MDTLNKNQIHEVYIESYNSEGMGVCHVCGRAVFVPRTIIGEQWEIKILKVSKTAVYAKALDPIRLSSGRTAAACPNFGKCGGCDLWHMDYSEELNFKLNKVNSALKHIGKQNLLAEEIIGSDSCTRYRNKGIFAIGEENGVPVFGFYRERSHEIISIDDCFLQSELSCRAARAVTEFMAENKVPAYDEASNKGVVRHVFCRQAYNGTDAVVCVVAAKGFGSLTSKLVNTLREKCPELSGIVLNVNKSRGNTVLSGDFYTLWGKESIVDTLCGHKFEIAPQAFFQINPPQAQRLYEQAMEYAQAENIDLAFDLYCGAGTISLCLAERAKKVIGAEIVPEAIENARENAEKNGLSNVEFICGDAGEAAAELAQRGLRPGVILVDPPRKGMSEDAVRAVASMSPERIVYVSCNCATLARDILRFNELGYSLTKVSAVDMFPRTAHIESVACLSRTSTHSMKLDASPFEKIKSGNKNIELRLFDEKRQKIKVGDNIIFTNTDNGEMMCAAVKRLHLFGSFEELYKTLPLLQCGYTAEDIDMAQPSDMERYYSAEEQKKYGVVGIELFPPKPITD